jgi:uncharacterized coiled-coil DUF342 family protein
MSRVKSLLSERESIDKELKHLREKIRKLNNRKKELEDLSVKYMKDTRTETVRQSNGKRSKGRKAKEKS